MLCAANLTILLLYFHATCSKINDNKPQCSNWKEKKKDHLRWAQKWSCNGFVYTSDACLLYVIQLGKLWPDYILNKCTFIDNNRSYYYYHYFIISTLSLRLFCSLHWTCSVMLKVILMLKVYSALSYSTLQTHIAVLWVDMSEWSSGCNECSV